MMIKVCGLTRQEDVDFCCQLGVNALGFILADSPRQVTLKKVKDLTSKIPPFVARVAVVQNPEKAFLEEIIYSKLFDYIQFHGEEAPEMIANLNIRTIKAISIKTSQDLNLIKLYNKSDYFLFDSKMGQQKGGTGVVFDWQLLKNINIKKPFILAGGLGLDNVLMAIDRVRPAGVDLNSRLESEPGIKSHHLLLETFRKIRNSEEVVDCE